MEKRTSDYRLNLKYGTCDISSQVIMGIAVSAAVGVEGVHDIKQKNVIDSIITTSQKSYITIEDVENGLVSITLQLIIKEGAVIPVTALNVQEAVVTSLNNIIGISRVEVNIVIDGVVNDKEDIVQPLLENTVDKIKRVLK